MNTFGIIAAMEEEISYINSKVQIKVTKNVAGLNFYIGTFAGNGIVVVRSGIGKVNAAVCTQLLIDYFAADYIINIGVAGALCKKLKIGDIIISKDVVHHDFNCKEFGYDIGIIPRMDESFFSASPMLIKIAETASKKMDTVNTFVARIASGDTFVANSEVKNCIWDTFAAYCVEMEGAAVAQTCFLNNVPFLIIRSISDSADESANNNYNEFIKTAAFNSALLLTYIIESF